MGSLYRRRGQVLPPPAALPDLRSPEQSHLLFSFPYITTEAVWPTDRSTLVIVNDNNVPNGGGRSGAARDATEFIRLALARPLCTGLQPDKIDSSR